MNFEISNNGSHILIQSKVEKLDINTASELKSEIVMLNKKGNNNFVLDLSATKYCDSSGLSSILMTNRIAKESSGVFVLVGLNATVQKMIQISQLDKVLLIREDIKDIEDLLLTLK